jgi:pimeloyl-ACP methyl ester carboxylesterase
MYLDTKMLHTIRILAIAFFAMIPSVARAQDDLPRRIMLGVQVQPVSEETRSRLKLRNSRGVEVVMVIPDSTAAAAGLAPGDVIRHIAGKEVKDPAGFVDTVSMQRADKELEIRLNRDGDEQTLKVMPKELPKETSNDWDIEYSSVVTPAGRMRTVVTMPKGNDKVPMVILLSGLGNGTIEHPTADPLGMRAVAHAFNRQGFGVMRIDKPGCGDSQGGPARDADFDSVVNGYVAGVRAIKKHSRLQSNNIFLVGFSMGGVQAPLVAAQESVQGIAVFGAMSCKWVDFIKNSTQRQLKLGGVTDSEIEKQVAMQTAGWGYLSDDKLTPDVIAEQHSELIEWVEKNWTDGKYFSGIAYPFFQQLCQKDVAKAWEHFDGPVLSLWGESDFVTFAEDHQLLAEIANRKQAGLGEFRKLAGVDHNLRLAASVEEAMKKPGTEPALVVVEVMGEWAKRCIAKHRKP